MRLSLQQRLISRSKVVGTCWEWQGSTTNGYGVAGHDYKLYRAHRLSAHCFLGFDLKSPKVVMHRCDNRKCINPDHLLVGTQSENLLDSGAKGRSNKGGPHKKNRLRDRVLNTDTTLTE